MIKSCRVESDTSGGVGTGAGISMELKKPEVTGFLIASITGLTDPKAQISTSEIATFDGATFGNAHVGPRNIVITIIFYEDNKEKLSIEGLRHKFYYYFPLRRKVRFYVSTDSSTYWIDGYIESNDINIFTKQEGAQVSIICPNPYFTKNNSTTTTYVSSIVPNFSFPVKFEMEDPNAVSTSTPKYREVITSKSGKDYYEYNGATSYKPSTKVQTAPTKDAFLDKNITFNKVTYEETSNNSGGTTVKIGNIGGS